MRWRNRDQVAANFPGREFPQPFSPVGRITPFRQVITPAPRKGRGFRESGGVDRFAQLGRRRLGIEVEIGGQGGVLFADHCALASLGSYDLPVIRQIIAHPDPSVNRQCEAHLAGVSHAKPAANPKKERTQHPNKVLIL
jgi:hypothetical protein